MTRNRKIDPAVLEREYIFDSGNPPVSLTDLANKYGMARSGIADKARVGRWYERREEFRKQLGEKTVEALGDQWIKYETAVREKMMQMGVAYLDKYVEALKNDEVKVNTRDMLGIAAMVRTLLGDAAASPQGEETLIDPTNVTLGPDDYRRAIATIEAIEAKQLESGVDGLEHAGEPEAPGAEGTEQD